MDIYIDIDGVLRNLSRSIIEVLLEKHYDKFHKRFKEVFIETNSDPITMDIFDEQDFRDYILYYVNAVYYHACPTFQSGSFIKNLKKNNHKIILSSKQMKMQNPTVLEATCRWINDCLPPYIDGIIFNGDNPKDILDSSDPADSVMIDDDPLNFPDIDNLTKIVIRNRMETRIPEFMMTSTENLYKVEGPDFDKINEIINNKANISQDTIYT